MLFIWLSFNSRSAESQIDIKGFFEADSTGGREGGSFFRSVCSTFSRCSDPRGSEAIALRTFAKSVRRTQKDRYRSTAMPVEPALGK